MSDNVKPRATVRDVLFKGFTGCSNHDCVVQKRKGMGTNGSCHCLHNFSRGQLHTLKSRLSAIVDKRIED